MVTRECYQAVTHTDVSKVNGSAKNPERVKRMMCSDDHHRGGACYQDGDISTNEYRDIHFRKTKIIRLRTCVPTH